MGMNNKYSCNTCGMNFVRKEKYEGKTNCVFKFRPLFVKMLLICFLKESRKKASLPECYRRPRPTGDPGIFNGDPK